jgi:lipopolysaccharide transport system ATP-binding protein
LQQKTQLSNFMSKPPNCPKVSGLSHLPYDDVLVQVEQVSKKFCRSLKKSLWYGMKDLGNELIGGNGAGRDELRPEEFWAVNDVSFELKRGECLGLIGRNGAGKTTLLKMLNGLIKPDKGRIEMKGRVGALIALGAGFNPILTGRENVYVAGAILGLKVKEIDDKYNSIVTFSELEEFMDTPVQSYSSGMQVRLGFAVAAQMEPDILLLDEVLAVGDAQFQIKCINVIRTLQERGVGIILVSHNMVNILRYSNAGLYLENGKIKSLGSIAEVTSLYLKDQVPYKTNEFSGNVPSNSGIALHKAYVTDVKGNQLSNITPWQTIELHLPYELEADFPPCLVELQLGINDVNGVYYQEVSTPLDFQGGSKGERGEFIALIKALMAATCRLTIGVALWQSPKGKMLAWSKENNFNVLDDKLNAGRVSLNVSWSVENLSKLHF